MKEIVAEALTEARAFVAEAAEMGSYGFFPGGDFDPRDFEPDQENTPEELAAHAAAVEAWDRGERHTTPRSGRIEDGAVPEMPDGKGGVFPAHTATMFKCGSSYGMGGITYRDPEAAALLVKIDAAIAALTVAP